MGNFAHISDIWANAPVALALTRFKTFAAAAQSLRVDRTTIARRLGQLEDALGARLFDRTNGQLILTNFGRQFIGYAEAAEEKLLSVADTDTNANPTPIGTVRVSIAPNLMPAAAPILLKLSEEHPHLQLCISASYRLEDVESRETDIGLRVLQKKPDASLHAVKLQDVYGAIYQSKSAQTESVPFIGRVGELSPPDYLKGNLEVKKVNLIVEGIVEHGLMVAEGGLGRMPIFMGEANPNLTRVSDRLPPEGWAVWLVTHGGLKDSPRVKVVFDHLKCIELANA